MVSGACSLSLPQLRSLLARQWACRWAIRDLFFLRFKPQTSFLAKQLLPFSSAKNHNHFLKPRLVLQTCVYLVNCLYIQALLFYTWNSHYSWRGSQPPLRLICRHCLLCSPWPPNAHFTHPISLVLTAFTLAWMLCSTRSLSRQAKSGLVCMLLAQPVSEGKKGSTWHLGLVTAATFHQP